MKGRTLYLSLILICGLSLCVFAENSIPQSHNILYLNSYDLDYPWADSVNKGIHQIMQKRQDVHLYTEFLDARRFGQTLFGFYSEMLAVKYKQIAFDAVITSDNDALDFAVLFGDKLFPDVPVIFCGINNPNDYVFENSRFYGFLDAMDLKTQINLIVKVLPEVRHIYFITDNSTTGRLNYQYVKKAALEYKDVAFDFVFLHNKAPDSLLNILSSVTADGAIALMNYHIDNKGNPLNQQIIYPEILRHASVPAFIDIESMIGKGIAGGIINYGTLQGKEAAGLALKFLDEPGFKPDYPFMQSKGKYAFDYAVLKKFGIKMTNLPGNAMIINRKSGIFTIRFLLTTGGIALTFTLLGVFLFHTRNKARKVKDLLNQQLGEITLKNRLLEEARNHVQDVNAELEEINEQLSITNEALMIAKCKSEESDKLKSIFLSSISHEVRTPLNVIVGFSTLLNDPSLKPNEKEEYLRLIGSNSNQLLRVIDNILDLSKIEAGQFQINIEPFSIHDFLVELKSKFLREISESKVELAIKEPANKLSLMMKSDRRRFKQIMNNLISNAFKFTKTGRIEIGYSLETKEEIVFFVKDTGIGIEEKEQKNIFHRFWKADTEHIGSGVGVGLAISKKLCDALGAKIWMDSLPNQGTTFFISFQDYILNIKESPVLKQKPEASYAQNLEGFRIAIAEDEKNNLFLLTEILRRFGPKILTFRSGREIVDFFLEKQELRVDIVLMDIKMPDMDGITAAKLIREVFPCLPIMAQTAYARMEDIEQLRSPIFNDYIIKPIKPTILIEKINNLLHPAERSAMA